MADKLTLDRQAMKNRATAHLRIYVGGLPDSATVDEMYEHFIPYGQINGIVVNRVFGFVQFDKESSVQEAISKADGSVFQGKQISVRPAQTNPEKRREEVVSVQHDKPPAVALSENISAVPDETNDDLYDSYGNYIGDQEKKRKRSRNGKRSRKRRTKDPSASLELILSDDDDDNSYREEEPEENYPKSHPYPSERVDRGRGRGAPRGRGVRGRGAGGFRDERGGGEWADRPSYGYNKPEYPRALPVPERNDCEIIVVSKGLTEYAEYIEGRLKHLGIVVDLLFPMEDVPIGKVLGNIASRGCLYAILVMPQNQEHRSLTLTILHGLPQEHRNMPLEDALQLLSRNFQEVQRGGSSGREAVYALLGQLADGRTLTVLQYDKVIEYMQERREQQVKIELGEPLPTTPAANKTQVDLQQRIMSILNEKKVLKAEPPPTPEPQPAAPTQNKLLNDPTVRKALDSILQKFT